MQLLKTTVLCGLSEDGTRTLHTAGAKSSRPGQRVPLPPGTTQLPPCPQLGDDTILGDTPSPLSTFSPRAWPSPGCLPPRDWKDLPSVTLAWPMSLSFAHHLVSPCSDRVKWGRESGLLRDHPRRPGPAWELLTLHSARCVQPLPAISPGKWGTFLPERRHSQPVPHCRWTPGSRLCFHLSAIWESANFGKCFTQSESARMVHPGQGSPADRGQGRRVLESAGTGHLPGWPRQDCRAHHRAKAQEPGRAPRSPAGASGPCRRS